MGWPKGMPRKGHVNKDGTSHAKRGSKLAAISRLPTMAASSARTKIAQRKIAQVDPSLLDGQEDSWFKREWKALLVHKTGPWTSLCPICTFPEAEGGYCPACGWTKPIVYA